MKDPIDIFRWKYGFQKSLVAIIAAVLFGVPYMYVVNFYGSVPDIVGMSWFLAFVCLLYGILKASQSERATIIAWSSVSLFGSGTLKTVVIGLSTETTAGIALTSISGVGLLTLSLAVIAFLLEKGYNKHTGRNGGEPTPEHRVLTESEYKDFAPHPYKDKYNLLPNPLQHSLSPLFPDIGDAL